MASTKLVCPNCQTPRRPGASFCFKCGINFDAAASSPDTGATHAATSPANGGAVMAPSPPAAAQAPAAVAPADVTSAGRNLIVLGSLSVLAALGLLAAYASGALEDRFDVASWFPIVAVLSGLVGGLGIVAGIGVLRLDPTWRIIGIIVAVIGVISMLINVFSGIFLSLVIMFFWGRVVFRLARSAEAFRRAAP